MQQINNRNLIPRNCGPQRILPLERCSGAKNFDTNVDIQLYLDQHSAYQFQILEYNYYKILNLALILSPIELSIYTQSACFAEPRGLGAGPQQLHPVSGVEILQLCFAPSFSGRYSYRDNSLLQKHSFMALILIVLCITVAPRPCYIYAHNTVVTIRWCTSHIVVIKGSNNCFRHCLIHVCRILYFYSLIFTLYLVFIIHLVIMNTNKVNYIYKLLPPLNSFLAMTLPAQLMPLS